MTEYEISGEPYSQKSGLITHSNELIFQVCSHSVVLPVKANIAQSLIGDWEHITVVDSKGARPPPRY